MVIRKELIFVKGDVEYMKLCINITIYWLGPLFVHRDGILHFYQRSLELIGSNLRHYRTGEMKSAERLDRGALELIPKWLQSPGQANDIYMLTLESHMLPDIPSDTAFGLWAVPFKKYLVGAIRVVLPANFRMVGDEDLQDVALDLVSKMNFHSGYCGYGINWDPGGRYRTISRRVLGKLARRFPGLDLTDIFSSLMAVPFGIVRINWLTFLGSTILEMLGGIDNLRGRLAGGDTELVETSGGLMIKGGSEPGIGDVNRFEMLESYHVVGRALSTVRSDRHPPFLGSARRQIDAEISETWLRYFDN